MPDSMMSFLNSGSFPPPPEEYVPGDILAFRGFTSGARPEEPGAGSLSVENSYLVARAMFIDSDLYNDARFDNAETWLLGDTFELMFQIRRHEDYYEFHSTPEGFRLQLHIPDYRTFRGIPHREKICEAGLEVRNRIRRSENLWESELRIPFSGIGLTEDELNGSRFVLVRQNHTHGKPAPEITATRVFPQTAHTPYLWHRLRCDQSGSR